MKQIQTLFSLFASLLVAACASNEAEQQLPTVLADDSRVLISMVASQAEVDKGATRAETTIQTALFDADEILQGYITHNTSPAVDFSPLLTTRTAVDGKNPLVADQQLYWPVDPSKTISLYALYPQTATASTFTVAYDQTSDEAYKASDLMWGGDHTAHAAMVVPYDNNNAALNIPFKHKMAKLIVNASTDGSVSGVVVNGITVKGVKRQIGFTPTTGVLGDDGTLSDEGDIVMTNNGACLLPPQTIAADAEFIEIAVTIGGNPYTAKYKAATAMPMVEGHQYTLDLMIGSQSLTLTSSITDWSDENATHTITPKQWGSLVMDAVSGTFTYAKDGLGNPVPHQPMPAVKSVDGTTLTNGTEFDYSWFANTNAGTALVVATGKSGTDYVGQVALQKFTIDKATPVVTAPTALSLTYNGTSASPATDQTLANAGSTDGGQLVYSTSEDGTYSDVIPTGKNAGGYDVWYKVVGDANYNDVAPAKLECAIAKKEIANDEWSIAPASLALKTGSGTPHTGDITIDCGTTYDNTGTGTISWVSSDATKAPVSDGTVTGEAEVTGATITVSIPNAPNYTFAGNHTCTVTVATDDPGVCLAQSQVGYIVAANGKAYPTSQKQWVMNNSSIVGMVAKISSTAGQSIVLAKSRTSDRYTYSNACNYSANAGNFYINDLTSKTAKSWICGSEGDYESCPNAYGFTNLTAAGCDALDNNSYMTTTRSNSGYVTYWDKDGARSGPDIWMNPMNFYIRPIFKF